METDSISQNNNKQEGEKRFFASASAVKAYEEMREQLRERGQRDFQFQKFVDSLLEKVSEKAKFEIVEALTPDDYYIHLALQDQDFRKRVLADARKSKVK